MSEWIEVKREQFNIIGDEVHIFVESDYFGGRYVFFKTSIIQQLLTPNL